jgi:hypothetical protein
MGSFEPVAVEPVITAEPAPKVECTEGQESTPDRVEHVIAAIVEQVQTDTRPDAVNRQTGYGHRIGAGVAVPVQHRFFVPEVFHFTLQAGVKIRFDLS